MAITKNSQIDLNGNEMILDADGDTTITADTDDQIDFKTAGTDRVAIGASGNLFVGSSTSNGISDGTTGLQVTGSGFNGAISASRHENNQYGSSLMLGKSRNTTVGSNTIVQDNDGIGAIGFFADDGTNLDSQVAYISASVDGTPGANDTPGRLTFSTTADGSAAVTERMRITSGGTILVGKSALDNTTAGIRLNANGQATMAREGSLLYLNRRTSDGTVIECAKDNTGIGGISSRGGEFIAVGSGDTNLEFNFGSDQVNPSSGTAARDNAIDLGSSSARFDDIYATNGTIQTSDQNEKNTITNSDLGLDFINKLSPKSYKFNGKTRTHYGLIAQDVETVLSDISKSAGDFAGFIKGDISEKQDGSSYRYGLRYGEFIAPLIKALQEADDKIDALTARIETLEGG